MPSQATPIGAQQGAALPLFTPPTVRETRAEAVHRLQVGLFGLCAMLLMVGLANIVMDRARLADLENPPATTTTDLEPAKKAATDPLADIGVVPAADPSAAAAANTAP